MRISGKAKEALLGFPGMWVALIPVKLYGARSSNPSQWWMQLRHALSSRELSNHSYHNTDTSVNRLVMVLANIDGLLPSAARAYCREVHDSCELQSIYRAARSPEKILLNLTDDELRAGRQLLFYCLTRALKPRVVFEAGTAHGIGALLLLHALTLNRHEGFPGRLVTVDRNPGAGRLFQHLPDSYRALLDFKVGDTEYELQRLDAKVDLFFHDTVNIADHEKKHYTLLDDRISASGVICSTWGMSGILAQYSEKSQRRYLEFTNEAQGHWCSDTIGISMPTSIRATGARPYRYSTAQRFF